MTDNNSCDIPPKQEEKSSKNSRKGKIATIIFFIIVAILSLIGGGLWLFHYRFYKYTYDAYVMGNQVMLTPSHKGIVTAINSDETFFVRRGDVIIELDESIARLRIKEAKDHFGNVVRGVCQRYHELFALRSEIEVRKAEYIKAVQDMEYRDDVISQGGVSLEDYEHAEAALRASYFSMKMAESLYQREMAMLQGVSIRNHPLVAKAADRVINAWIYLYRCKIYAPVDGLVAQRKIQVGMRVKPGEPLLAVIPLDQIWVDANYKETQMKYMRIGQAVRLTSEYYGREVAYHGKIIGLPGGAGNAFSLLPPQNLSGNWINIVQRLPVRVRLDENELKAYPLRIGLTMRSRVDIHDTSGPMIAPVSEKSPQYRTDVFCPEEKGSQEFVAEIFSENLDPSLICYADNPLIIEDQVSETLVEK